MTHLVSRVVAVADDVAATLRGPAKEELDRIRAVLAEPLRVAVAGRVKAGKSTLVNALLGQRVAPTDVSECTKVVTWFRYGNPERVELVLRDGGTRLLRLRDDGTLPEELGVDPTTVARLEVHLSNNLLRDLTLIDTPGLSSVNEHISAATERLLSVDRDSTVATAQAQAIAFVLNQNAREDELRVLRDFRSRSHALDGSAVNAVGVLTKADKVGGGGPESWLEAAKIAGRQADQFRSDVSTVVPVVGLLAETAEAAVLTEADAVNLRTLAALDPASRMRMLWSADRFVGHELTVPRPARERLLRILDLYGLERALELIGSGVTGAVELCRELAQASGIALLREVLVDGFRRRDDALKARAALDAMERLSFSRDGSDDRGLAALRNRVEALRLAPDMHELRELDALHACCTGEVVLPAPLFEEVHRLGAGSTAAIRVGAPSESPEDVRRAATEAVARWRSFLVAGATPLQARVARVMVRSYQLALSRSTVLEGAR